MSNEVTPITFQTPMPLLLEILVGTENLSRVSLAAKEVAKRFGTLENRINALETMAFEKDNP